MLVKISSDSNRWLSISGWCNMFVWLCSEIFGCLGMCGS